MQMCACMYLCTCRDVREQSLILFAPCLKLSLWWLWIVANGFGNTMFTFLRLLPQTTETQTCACYAKVDDIVEIQVCGMHLHITMPFHPEVTIGLSCTYSFHAVRTNHGIALFVVSAEAIGVNVPFIVPTLACTCSCGIMHDAYYIDS